MTCVEYATAAMMEAESTPTARPMLTDESTLEMSLGDTTSNISSLHKGDDSLLGSALLGSGSDTAPSLRHLSESLTRSSEECETPEQVQAQLLILRQLNEVFEAYEKTLSSSLEEMNVFSQKIKETDALLNVYLHILTQAQRRRALMNDTSWHGATQEAQRERELRQREAQMHAAAAASAATASMTTSTNRKSQRGGSTRPPSTSRGSSTTRPARGRAPPSSRASTRGRAPTHSSMTRTTTAAPSNTQPRARFASSIPVRGAATHK